MILTTFGKEFIIINEELAIYVSFLIVLTILVSTFGEKVAAQFAEQATTIAQSYGIGSELKVKNYLKQITFNYETFNFLNHLTNTEINSSYKLLKFKSAIVTAITAAEYKFI